MKDIILFMMLLLIFILFGLRISIQFSAVKERNILGKLKVDSIFFLIPEFTPIKSFRKELGDDINEQIESYFKKVKIYRILLFIVLILFLLAIIFFDESGNK